MSLKLQTLFLSFLFLLLSCQVEEKTGSSGLISGHAPTSNSFSVVPPAAKTYIAGETVSLTVTFPFPVSVTGMPRLELMVGATSRYANYLSGNGTKTLIFQYAFVMADNDTDGIAIVDLELNGGTLTFDNKGVTTNCDIATVVAQTFASVKVDNTGPTISSLNHTNLPGFYNVGEKLNFTVVFNEPVFVTGTPSFGMTFASPTSPVATYTGGSGTTALTFSFTIRSTDYDTNGINSLNSPIALNGGTIKDAAGNNATLTFTASAQALVVFDGRLPYVVNATPPANGTYVAAQNLDLILEFNETVTVATATPYIELTIGSNIRQASYISGSGTKFLTFRYTTIPGDVDLDGITVATFVTQNGAAISSAGGSYFAQAANNSYVVPTTTGVICNAVQPAPTSVSRNIDSTIPIWGSTSPDNVWIIGQDLLITVGFNTNIFVNQNSGTPRIPLTIGSTQRYAAYLSGGDGQTSLVFRYVIQENDLDTDGSIAIGNIDLNGGTITDAANTNSFLTLPQTAITSTTVDGVRPTIISVTPPVNNTYSQVSANNQLNFTVNWSEAVNYSTTAVNIPLIIGASGVNATQLTGGTNNNRSDIPHRYTIASALTDTDGIQASSPLTTSAVISDQAGNTANVLTYTPPAMPAVLVDTTAPTVVSMTAPANGTYLLGETVDFTVTFSEPVTTNVVVNYPRIQITVGSTTRYLVPTSNSTNTVHTFRYIVPAGDEDLDGITLGTTVNSNATGYARDAGQNWVSGTIPSPPVTTGILVDARAPLPTLMGYPAPGTYVPSGTGPLNDLTFTVTYDESVIVTGTPRIAFPIGTGTIYASYIPGSSTPNSLVFNYSVSANDMDLDGLTNGTYSISLNGGTIQDANSNNASLNLGVLTVNNLFIAPKIIVWMKSSTTTTNNSGRTGKPTISTNATLAAPYYTFNPSQNMTISTPVLVDEAYLAIRTPVTAPGVTEDLLDNEVVLTGGIDIATPTSASVTITSGYSGAGIAHNTNLPTNTVYQMQIIFGASVTIGTALIPLTNEAAVAEIVLTDGVLNATQRTHIYNYLDGKY